MITALMIFHGIISVLLILVVLLQFGKGAEAGLISGGGSDAVFTGPQQGNILVKITTVLAVLFMANSILLAKMQSQKSESSILDSVANAPVSKEVPATTTPSAPAAPAAATPDKNQSSPKEGKK